MFSTTTIPLSTSIPNARINENKTMVLRVTPTAPKINMERSILNGIAIPTNKAFLSPKKNNRTSTTNRIPKMILFSNSLTILLVSSLWSLVLVMVTSLGMVVFCASSIILSMDSDAFIKFAPPRFLTSTITTGCWYSRAKLVTSASSNTTSAISLRYTMLNFSCFIVTSSISEALVKSPTTRTVLRVFPLKTSPPEMVMFSFFMAFAISLKLISMASIFARSTFIFISFPVTPRMSTSVISGSPSILSSKYSAYSFN